MLAKGAIGVPPSHATAELPAEVMRMLRETHAAVFTMRAEMSTVRAEVDAMREQMRAALAHLTGQGLVKAIGTWEEYVEQVSSPRPTPRLALPPRPSPLVPMPHLAPRPSPLMRRPPRTTRFETDV